MQALTQDEFKANFKEVFEDLMLMVSHDLVLNDRIEVIKAVCDDARLAWTVSCAPMSTEELHTQWMYFVEKYNFRYDDEADDIWMNIKLTVLDFAGLKP